MGAAAATPHESISPSHEPEPEPAELGEKVVAGMKIRNFKPYVWCAAFTSIGGFVFGFDTGSIGPITLMPNFTATFGPLSPTIQGLVVSSILIPASLASFFAGAIADRISRIYAISLGATLFALGALLCSLAGINHATAPAPAPALAPALAQLFVGRCISGIGEGIFLSCITVYSVEIAPRRIRATVACICQLFISTGIMVGYFVCYGSLHIGSSSLAWRVPFVCQVLCCTLLAVGAPWLPHSPRWLLLVNRRADARKALTFLGLDAVEAAELMARPSNTNTNTNTSSNTSNTSSSSSSSTKAPSSSSISQFRASWSPAIRSRTLLAIYMMGAQQLSGIDGILYYAPMLFTQAGLTSANASFLASGVTGIVNVVFTALGQSFSDRFGRRPMIIYGGLCMAAAMTVIGAIYSIPSPPSLPQQQDNDDDQSMSKSKQYAVIAMIFVYFVSFIVSWGILVRIHVSEAQPVETRASVAAQAQSANWVVNWVVAFTTPMFLKKSRGGPYLLWAASIWVSCAVYWAVLPETRGLELEGNGDGDGDGVEVRKLWGSWRRRRGKVEVSDQGGRDITMAVGKQTHLEEKVGGVEVEVERTVV